MPRILLQRWIPWMLAAFSIGMMTHTANAGSFTRGCAARDIQLLTTIEEQESAGSIAAKSISDALVEMMHARIVCYQGRVLDALAIYDTVAESVRPICAAHAQANSNLFTARNYSNRPRRIGAL